MVVFVIYRACICLSEFLRNRVMETLKEPVQRRYFDFPPCSLTGITPQCQEAKNSPLNEGDEKTTTKTVQNTHPT